MPDTNVWISLAITLYVVIAVGLVAYATVVRRASVFDPLVQCVTFISLFTLPLPLRSVISDVVEGDVTEHLPQLKPYMAISVTFAALGLLCFAVAYYSRFATALGRALPQPPVVRRPRVYRATLLLAGFSVVLLVLLAKDAGGLLAFVLLGYNSSEETFGRGYLAIGFPWLFVTSLFLLYRYAMFRQARDAVIAAAFMIVLTVVQLLLGNRSVVLYMGLAVALFINFAIRRIHLRALVPIATIGFLFLNIVGYLRNSHYESLSDFFTRSTTAVGNLQESGDIKRGWFYTVTTGEFVVPFETMPEMVKSVGSRVTPLYGLSFLRAPVFVVPSALYQSRPLPLSNWYMAEFYGSGFGLNEGRAFFFLSEGYLNFGPAGVALVMFVWGILFGGVREYMRLGEDNPGTALLVALSVAFIFRAVAGDFSSLVIALPEQNLSCAVIGLAIMTGFAHWYRFRPAAGVQSQG